MTGPRRKRTRLPAARYADVDAVCSVTIAVAGRERVFADPQRAGAAVTILEREANHTGVAVSAYCFMPDHVHLLLSPSVTTNIIDFVGRFKRNVLRDAWSKGVVGSFWQQGFWDHFVRSEKDLHHTILYIFHNPVRAGIVSDWREYPHLGPRGQRERCQ